MQRYLIDLFLPSNSFWRKWYKVPTNKRLKMVEAQGLLNPEQTLRIFPEFLFLFLMSVFTQESLVLRLCYMTDVMS